jgi:hypothetical protein
MFDEKNIYVRQAEIKGSFKQNSNGTFLIGELTVNSSLKNYKQILHKAFQITMDELTFRNSEFDCECDCKKDKEKSTPKPPKKETKPTNVKGLK